MSTVGHPLSDLCNILTPFFTASHGGVNAHPEFLAGATPGLPQPAQLVRWYAQTSGWDPTSELNWGMAFNMFRSSAICQGIAARLAQRQASSEQAKRHADTRGPLAEVAWHLVGKSKQGVSPVAKL